MWSKMSHNKSVSASEDERSKKNVTVHQSKMFGHWVVKMAPNGVLNCNSDHVWIMVLEKSAVKHFVTVCFKKCYI